MLNKEIIRKKIVSALHKLKSDFHVNSIGLFGSFVRGDETSDSDIDLLIDFEPGMKSADNFFSVCDYLETILEHDVDVVTRAGLSPHMKPFIESEVEVYEI
jgi:hypothetical protein